jgi:alkanesulfonate monooxygenase SsuD/methylene tetrahydromethanopterin reductase-like flavin-dependent oxidoreductase (luciferase family)
MWHRSEPGRAGEAFGMSDVPRLGVLVPRNVDPGGFAEWAEETGLDIVATGEHLHSTVFAHHALLALAAAAARTSRIRLLTSVTLFPAYSAVLLAKMLSYVDWLSSGRLEVGLGLGGEIPQDLQGAPVPVARRGRYVDAALPVLKQLLAGEQVTAAGEGFALEDVRVCPGSIQRPHPPFWIAGRSGAAVRRAVANGAGWLPYLLTPAEISQRLNDAGGSRPDRLAAIVAVSHPIDRASAIAKLQQVLPAARNTFRLHDYVVGATGIEPVRSEYSAVGVQTLVVRSPFDGDQGWRALRDLMG